MSTNSILNFGHVIKWGSGHAVYLYGTPNVTYLAIILSEFESLDLIGKRKFLEKKITEGELWAEKQLKNNYQFQFIELTTKDFQNRVALYEPYFDDPNISSNLIICRLNNEDLKQLVIEIGGYNGPIILYTFWPVKKLIPGCYNKPI
jgi:hypothetical protein